LLQPPANSPGEFLDFLGFSNGRQRNDVAAVLFQFGFQLLGGDDQLLRVLQRARVGGLRLRVLLRPAIREFGILILAGRWTLMERTGNLSRQPPQQQSRQQQEPGARHCSMIARAPGENAAAMSPLPGPPRSIPA